MHDADFFAYNQYRDYIIYKELAKRESVPEFKNILESLINQEWEDYSFWLQFSRQKRFTVSRFQIVAFVLLRKIFGFTFTAKFLEGREGKMIQAYSAFLESADERIKNDVRRIIEHEREHERKLISQIKEEKIEFLGNIILGLNDGLIELAGALVGFALAFNQSLLAAASGIIVGFSAALSMASSAYMQARYEEGKQPVKAALYTGVAYLIIVAILTAPFFVFSQIKFALGGMLVLIFLIIVSISFYSSVLFERSFLRQAGEMVIFSIGVSLVAFTIGLLVREFIPALSSVI